MAMNAGTKTALAVATGSVAAALYFREGERGITQDRCSYLSPWTTDAAAWGMGATLIWLGYRHKSFLITFIGAALATLHVAQFAAHKVAKRPTLEELMEGKFPIQDLDAYQQAQSVRDLQAEGLI